VEKIGIGRVLKLEKIEDSMKEKEFEKRCINDGKISYIDKSGGKDFGLMNDDGYGNVEIFSVEKLEMEKVDKDNFGMLFGGDSYVVKYIYEKNGRENYIIYLWKGKERKKDEKEEYEIKNVRIESEIGGRDVKVRVNKGNEKSNLLRILRGKMIVLMGGKDSGLRNINENDK
jgi:gelsolin